MLRQYLFLWRRLAPLHRLGAIALAVGNLFASMLEVLGLALFGAVLLRLTQTDAVPPWQGLAGTFGLPAAADLATVAAVCGAVYFAKNALMMTLAWLEARLTFGVHAHLSVLTLATMLQQDYEVASRENQSARVNLLTGGMYALAFNVLLPGLTLLAEATLMVALVVFLLWTQPPFVAGMLAVLSLVAGLLVLVSRKLVLRQGLARQRSEDDKLQLLTGILSHLREMHVYSAGPRAVDHLQALLARLTAAYRGFQLVQTAPRFLLEVALVGILLSVIYWQARTGLDPTLVVSIGVFGVAGFRLLLGVNRIVACVQAMRFAGPTVARISGALSAAAPGAAAAEGRGRVARPGVRSLRLVGVAYAYDPRHPVLEGVDLELSRGTLVAINGRSGAGKSTLLEIMAGLRSPGAGWVELDGRRIAHKQDLVGRIAYAGQQPAVFPDTIRANVAFGRSPAEVDDEAVWRALARARLDEVVRRLPGQLDHRLGFAQTLSGGQVQRLAIARALCMDCDFLLLDEPTAALDAETEMQLLATLRELAATTCVVIVSHRPAPLEAADVVWTLGGGRLVSSDLQVIARE